MYKGKEDLRNYWSMAWLKSETTAIKFLERKTHVYI